MNREHWNGYGLTPDDIPEPAGERDADLLPPRAVCVYDVEPMTDEQVRAEMSRLMGFQLTVRQALS